MISPIGIKIKTCVRIGLKIRMPMKAALSAVHDASLVTPSGILQDGGSEVMMYF